MQCGSPTGPSPVSLSDVAHYPSPPPQTAVSPVAPAHAMLTPESQAYTETSKANSLNQMGTSLRKCDGLEDAPTLKSDTQI